MTSRRRSTPWIQTWARPIIGGVAGLGFLNTAYLTYMKFFGGDTACATGSCRVLASPYAVFFGQPLSLFGMLAYAGIVVLAIAPLFVNEDSNRSLKRSLEDKTWMLLFLGTTGMALFSGWLMYIMFSQFVAPLGLAGVCPFCLASAIFAAIMFGMTLLGRDWDDKGTLIFQGILVGIATLVVTFAGSGSLTSVAPSTGAITNAAGNTFFLVDTTSGDSETQLAKHLKETGAKMYGAYWCPHCCEQKQLFGKEAMKEFNYVECADDGKNADAKACASIRPEAEKQTGQSFGFPSWEVGGKFYAGRQTLADLAKNSGYTGPKDFKNAFQVCRQP
ncbi:MAG: vitamin K epoxide reductase family protein [Cyanobacteria bacterium]|nr:vitamin K epoxide reductase family protein [Cyanobacteriota bacterium]